MPIQLQYLENLPLFLTWFGLAAAMLLGFAFLYAMLTPWGEIRLIRQGNVAAAASFSGAIIGYAIVLAAIISGATSRTDLLAWGLVGLAVQIVALGVARLVLGRGLRQHIRDGQVASGIFLGALSLAAGILNAATMLT